MQTKIHCDGSAAKGEALVVEEPGYPAFEKKAFVTQTGLPSPPTPPPAKPNK